jgi:flagellar protein FlbD
MINITKLNDKDMVINCELIESIESTPDTTITMTTGRKLIVRDTVDDVLEKIIAYKQRISIKIL